VAVQASVNLKETLKKLIYAGRVKEADRLFISQIGDRSSSRLIIDYARLLQEGGFLDHAEEILVQALKNEPENFALLMTLAGVDEKKGQNLNAFDLYQRAEFSAQTAKEKNRARAALAQVKRKIKGRVQTGTDSFTLTLKGNDRPLELEYSLQLLARRKVLLEALLAAICPRAKTVLEIECDAGIVTKNLTDHGFRVEGIDSNMNNIVLAMGFEYVEILRKAGLPSPDYYHFAIDEEAAEKIERKDVIMVLPFDPAWYLERGPEKAAATLETLAGRARRQLFFFIPKGGEEDQNRALEKGLLAALETRGNLPEAPRCLYREKGGGALYVVNQKQAGRADKKKVLPEGSAFASTRSSIFEVPVEKCRSLNGFCYTESGWDHFTACLKEKIENPDLKYEESILNKFYENFRPRNRWEHLFGTGSDPVKPLDQGWTLLPWMETKNRIPNPVKSPVTRNDGNHHYGPNSERFIKLELKKLFDNFNLMSRYGYCPEIFPDGYVLGYFLKDGDDYLFLVTEGQHRMAAIGVLGKEQIKAKLSPDFLPLVDIKKVKQWPQVKSGLYTRELAEKVFYYYFEEDGRRKAKEVGLLEA